MSGSTDHNNKCPRCGGRNFSVYADWKPIDAVSGNCLDCGLTYWTEVSILGYRAGSAGPFRSPTLSCVNELRKEHGLAPLRVLRKPLARWIRNGWEPRNPSRGRSH